MAPERDRIVVRIDPEIADLVPGFLANRSRDVDLLRKAVANSDCEALRHGGHVLKGVGGGYGFPRISSIGERLEEAALAGEERAAAAAVEELADYLARLQVEVG